MAGTTERELSDWNVFQKETDSKTIQKETVNVESENDINSSSSPIACGKDKSVSNIQAEYIMAAANSMESSSVSTGEVKTSNSDFGGALNRTLRRNFNREGTSSGIHRRTSLTESLFTASIVEKMCEDARKYPARALELIAKVNSTCSKLQGHMKVFEKKVIQASKFSTEHGRRVKILYDYMACEYKSLLTNLEGRDTEIMLGVMVAATHCRNCAELVARTPYYDEELTRLAKLIRIYLEKERDVLLNMKRVWIAVQTDLQNVSKHKVGK